MSAYECYRNDLITRLAEILPHEQMAAVMAAVDETALSYDISRKSTDLIVATDIPPVLGYYLASKTLENLSTATINSYKSEIMRFFRMVKKPPQDIVANDIRCYLAQYKLNGKTGDSTIDLYRRILNGFFSWLVANEYLLRNPCAPIASIKYQAAERKPLTGYDLEVLRVHCETPREKALVDFLFSTGCRVSECAAAKLSDIDWQQRSVIIRHGKGDKMRTVFFNAESEVSLRVYLKTRKDDCDIIFCRSRHGVGPMSSRSIEIEIHKIRDRAQITAKCTPHVLRHTFATTGLRAGIPLEKLQALMGHSKPDTTLIYAKLDHNDLQRAHQSAFN